MIKYLGSKRKLLDQIVNLTPPGSVLDLFSGTARVSHALKRNGHQVFSNDLSSYAHILATTYCQVDREDLLEDVEKLIRELNSSTKTVDGYFTETFCRKSRFFQPFNGERVDAIREAIVEKSLDPELEAVLLTSLMEAADRVDSTTGVQMAYLKQWAARSFNKLELRVPDLVAAVPLGKCLAYQSDALELARAVSADVAYLDPPYNQHSYLGNYHIWESLVKWDKPEVYGVACKRLDTKTRKSPLNSKAQFENYFVELIQALNTKKILVSFSNEGFVPRDRMEEILSQRGPVKTHAFDYKRYVGAQIGVHNPQGRKVGEVSHTANVEYIFEVDVLN